MSGDFLDSNVILYVFDVDVRKGRVARRVVNDALRGEGRISFQVVQEVLHILTRETPSQVTESTGERALREILLPRWDVMPSASLYERGLRLGARYGIHFYDSLIVAAALEAGCRRLLTEDLQDGQRIDGLTVVNPFRE